MGKKSPRLVKIKFCVRQLGGKFVSDDGSKVEKITAKE